MRKTPLENPKTYSHKIIAILKVKRFSGSTDALNHL